jgi:hypothetical protein
MPALAKGQPGITLVGGSGAVSALLPNGRHVETLLRELAIRQVVESYAREGVVINRPITEALHDEFQKWRPGGSRALERRWTELFVRLLANLRSAQVLSASHEAVVAHIVGRDGVGPEEAQGRGVHEGLLNPALDGFRITDPHYDGASASDHIQRLLTMRFSIAGFEGFPYPHQKFYGRALFGLTPLRQANEARARRQVSHVRLEPRLDELLQPVLDRQHPGFWEVFGQRPAAQPSE